MQRKNILYEAYDGGCDLIYSGDYDFIYGDVYDKGFIFYDEEEIDEQDYENDLSEEEIDLVDFPLIECPGQEEIGIA